MDQPEINSLLDQIETGWKALNDAVDQLTVTQATERKDAQGWSVKDHLYHLMVWENSLVSFLRGQLRSGGLGVSEELFQSGSGDEINAAIYQLGRTSSLYEVRVQHQTIHNRLVGLLGALSETALDKPYAAFLTDHSGDTRSARQVVLSNTTNHYREHLEWMRALVEGSQAK